VVYVNTAIGVNAPTSGAIGAPYQSIDYAISQLVSESVNNQITTQLTIALQAGQTFPTSVDINLYGGLLTFTFYGDANYGSFNSAPIGTGAQPGVMTDLNRPIIAPTVSLVNEYWHLAGINLWNNAGVSFLGVEILLPLAPAQPAIALYSNSADYVRTLNAAFGGTVQLVGTIVNMQDITAFWGILGVGPASNARLLQYASQFKIGNTLMDAANNPTASQLAARQYFIKFYPHYVGNNQQQGVLYDTAATATPASGLLDVQWADTESFVVESTKTNLLTFPICYDLVYGLRTYMYGVNYDGINRPWNVHSSREI
jgi:hypothetical protein